MSNRPFRCGPPLVQRPNPGQIPPVPNPKKVANIMQEAAHESTTSRRRNVLGAIGASGLAAIAIAGFGRPDEKAANKLYPDADADLLRLVDRLKAKDAAILVVSAWGDEFDETPLELDDRLKVLEAELRMLRGKIGSMRAHGLAGLRAKVSVAWGLEQPYLNHQPEPNDQHYILWSLARDLGAENATVISDVIGSAGA